MNKEKAALDQFGKVLITRVRDETIDDWERTFDGQMRGNTAIQVRHLIRGFSSDQVALLKLLVPKVVDDCIHHLLWTLEQSDKIKLSVLTDSGTVEDLNSVSDGLPGEMYSDEGWIARFSRYQEKE
jgi:hypothetical protein